MHQALARITGRLIGDRGGRSDGNDGHDQREPGKAHAEGRIALSPEKVGDPGSDQAQPGDPRKDEELLLARVSVGGKLQEPEGEYR